MISEAGSRREAQPPLQSSSLPFWAAPLGVFRSWPLFLTGIRPSGRTGLLALYAIVKGDISSPGIWGRFVVTKVARGLATGFRPFHSLYFPDGPLFVSPDAGAVLLPGVRAGSGEVSPRPFSALCLSGYVSGQVAWSVDPSPQRLECLHCQNMFRR